MAPKKKGGKKAANDDWENEIGEQIDPIKQAAENAKAEEAAADAAEDEDAGMGGGGLLAALKKNRGKKQKKGKAVEDFVEGEDLTADGTASPAPEPVDLASKAPVEASFEDDEDVFGQPMKKGKGGGKGGKQQPEPKDDDDDEADGSGKLKTKAQKEKEKKEREKQRKKEQVCRITPCYIYDETLITHE